MLPFGRNALELNEDKKAKLVAVGDTALCIQTGWELQMSAGEQNTAVGYTGALKNNTLGS
ncbi:MAG: hypothetical protein IPP72_07795 [Chitinophagaceae bacterium]|nr:hypothetical protein [Chitinophagaceae bacterium]